MTEVKEHSTFYSEEGVNEKNTKEVDTLWKHAVYNAKKKDYFDLEKECYLCTKHEVPLIRFHAQIQDLKKKDILYFPHQILLKRMR